MAGKGDTVTCSCGARLLLENSRLPWHKRPGTAKNCQFSGVDATYREADPLPSYFVNVGGMKLKLACPACGNDKHVKNAPAGSDFPLVCGACGGSGSLEEFLSEALSGLQSGRKHRYAG